MSEISAIQGLTRRHALHPPAWKSSRFIAYVFTAVILVAALALNAPAGVLEHLSLALELALPVLIGGESWRRVAVDGQLSKATSVNTDTVQP